MDADFETLLNGQQFKKLFEKRSSQITEKYGLHKIEIEILFFLKMEKYDTARDIVEGKHFSKGHVSHAIEHLMECGYLTGEPDAHDRRCIHLRLTEEAEPVCQEILKLRKKLRTVLFKGLTAEEKRMMEQVAKKIAHNISAELEV